MNDNPAPGDSKPILADDGSELRRPACDYDLRALQGDRCPECGLLLDRAGMAVSQIPWTHRREMGRFRAFRKTCWMTFRRPKRIAADAARPVSFRDARRFQRAVIWTMYVPMVGIGLWALFATTDGHPFRRNGTWQITRQGSPSILYPHNASPQHWVGFTLEAIGLPLAAICLWLFLKSITGVASYFFHPRDLSVARQNRAIALSYYACAPLAWTPISLALGVMLGLFSTIRWNISEVTRWQIAMVLGSALFMSVAVQLAAWLRCTLVLLKQTTRCSGVRVLTAGVSLPFLWIICGVVTLAILPGAYLLLCMVIMSLS